MDAPALPVQSDLVAFVSNARAFEHGELTAADIRAIEQRMLQHPQQIDIAPVHYFADGQYAREITVPAGALITGLVHRHEHLNVISKGRIRVWTEEGMKTIQAPFMFVSKPGTKRIGFAYEETVWTTIHANPDNESDILKLEDRYVENVKPQLETKCPSSLSE